MALFLFCGWVILYILYHIFFIQASIDGHHVLAFVNSVAMNIGVYISFQIMVFSRYMSRSRSAGPYGSSIFRFFFFLLFFHTIFHHVLTQVTGHSSWCCTVGSHYLSVLNVIVCIYQPQTPHPSPSVSPPPGKHKSNIHVHDLSCFLDISSLPYFRLHI